MLVREKQKIILLLFAIGIFARFFVMSLGHNFDFESYCIVGEIAGNFRTVYAETTRYNYGFIFFCIQGLLYRIAQFNPSEWVSTYRILLVSVFTLADIGIALVLADRKSWDSAMIFFLNPVSIIITGYHNQFDNIAIFFALLSMYYYNKENTFDKRDFIHIFLIAVSLIIKHILFLLPVFMFFKKELPFKKKIAYVCIPSLIFLMSFVPFALISQESFNGIIHNVFLYRSFNNAPLLKYLYELLNVSTTFYIVGYGIFMCIIAFIVKNENYEKTIMFYLISMLCCSSAIANQYLVIPMVALCYFDLKLWKYIYMISATAYLMLESDGLGILEKFIRGYGGTMEQVCVTYVQNGYTIVAIILLIVLISSFRKMEKFRK